MKINRNFAICICISVLNSCNFNNYFDFIFLFLCSVCSYYFLGSLSPHETAMLMSASNSVSDVINNWWKILGIGESSNLLYQNWPTLSP